jgi:membrane protease YdiL (CAAX protease family)
MLVLFIGAPVAMAVFYGAYSLFGALLLLTLVAVVLLATTPGFSVRSLAILPTWRDWLWFVASVAVMGAVLVGLALWLVPHRFLAFPRYSPDLWLRVMLLYPLLSALPQEVIYRSLFFERYGALFPSATWAILTNAALFGLGHLFYGNLVAVGLSAAGGLVMAAGYLRRRSLIFAVLLHAIAGQILFTAGLGVYFYHGAIQP